jgi:Spy/CpxP family protein refolding chaperone
MKNLRFKSVVLAVTAALAIGSVTLYAQKHGDAHKRGGHGKMEMLKGKIAKELNLTVDQQTKLENMWKSFKESNKATREQLQDNRKQLRELMKTDNYSKAQAEQLIKQNAELEAKLKIARLNQMDEMKKVLTAEQQAKFKELREKRFEKMKDRRENREMKRDNRANPQERSTK